MSLGTKVKGETSIYRQKNGRFAALSVVTHANGTRDRKTKTFDTVTQARQWLAERRNHALLVRMDQPEVVTLGFMVETAKRVKEDRRDSERTAP